MSTMQLAGIFLVAGTLSFWIGAGLPTWRVYATSDPDARAKIITDLRGYWVVAHLLFAAGVVATVAGFGVFTSTLESPNARTLALVGLAAIALGSLVWIYIVVAFRLSMPAEEYVRTTAGGWTFPVYAVLTLGALIVYGIVLYVAGFPTWLGIVAVGLSSLILIAFVIQGDSIPALFYIVPLIMGIVFLT